MGEMDELTLRRLLEDVRYGRVTSDEALDSLKRLPFSDLGFARVDHHRPLRQGTAEAVYAPGKSPEQCALIVAELLSDSSAAPVVLTRADKEQVEAALAESPSGEVTGTGRLYSVVWNTARQRSETVTVVTAGTADLPVADECAAVLRAFGFTPYLLCDCGVAGLHRLLSSLDHITQADAVAVVAGMEGALASVVGGIAACPVVAVPTSAGYGAALDGVTALLAMLSSCAAGITVVGIDNGFGAACAIARVLR